MALCVNVFVHDKTVAVYELTIGNDVKFVYMKSNLSTRNN